MSQKRSDEFFEDFVECRMKTDNQKIEQTMIYAHFSPNYLSDAITFNPVTQYSL